MWKMVLSLILILGLLAGCGNNDIRPEIMESGLKYVDLLEEKSNMTYSLSEDELNEIMDFCNKYKDDKTITEKEAAFLVSLSTLGLSNLNIQVKSIGLDRDTNETRDLKNKYVSALASTKEMLNNK